MTLRKFLIIAAVVFCCTAMAGTTWADSVPVLNSSFENASGSMIGCGPGCAYNWGPIPNWITSGAGGSFQPGSNFSSIPDGNLVAFLSSGSLSQTLGASLLSNTAYTLTVDVLNRAGFGTGYSIGLFDGSTQLCSFSGNSTSGIALGGFQAESCSFSTGSTVNPDNLTVVLTKTGSGGQFDFDNVSVTTSTVATPEPSSILMLSFGLIIALAVVLVRGKGIIPSGA